MKKTALSISVFLVLSSALWTSQAQQKEILWRDHILRIAKNSSLEGEALFYFEKLTPFLLDFLETESQGELSQKLPDIQTLGELRGYIQSAFEADLIDLGENMFRFFEKKAPRNPQGPSSRFESEHFVFLVCPQTPAEEDGQMILEYAEKTYAAVADLLSLEKEMEKSLSTVWDEGNQTQPKITVRLHPGRTEEAEKNISKRSLGAAHFGATIDKEGNGRLTAGIDVLYFNGFSLSVLDHEIAHMALMLGSFDVQKLTEKPLQGEADLRRAFFAGYKKIPLFLQEGIGDYSTYFFGFYDQWSLVPPFHQLILSIISDSRYIPMKKLITENGLFIMKNHKRFSLEAGSFIRFLASRFEKDKLKQWLLSGDRNPDENFKNIFGVEIEAAEKNWHESLKASAEAASGQGFFDFRADRGD